MEDNEVTKLTVSRSPWTAGKWIVSVIMILGVVAGLCAVLFD